MILNHWISFTVVMPLLPILVSGIVIAMRGETVRYEALLGGAELFFICLCIAASTARDLEDAKSHLRGWAPFELANCVMQLLLMSLCLCTMFVFLDRNFVERGLDREYVANLAICFAVLSAAICLSAQIALAKAEKPKRGRVAE